MKKSIFFLLIIGIFSCAETPTPKEIQEAIPKATQNAIPKSMNNTDSKNKNTDVKKIEFSMDYVMGKIDPPTHKDFVEIATTHASKKQMFLRKDAYEAFIKMYEAAKKEGISLKILSATRPFNHQKSIWEAKWTGERLVGGKKLNKSIPDAKTRALKILEFSSMPGTSRHHWGTDIDINAFENAYFAEGKGKKEYDWLKANAGRFGFCQSYTSKDADRPNGYNEEKWHWSYKPVAQILTQKAKNELKDSMIKGFKGAETAPSIGVVEKYILGINKECF